MSKLHRKLPVLPVIDKQHLTTDEVLATLQALQYSSNEVIARVNHDGFIGAEITNQALLDIAIADAWHRNQNCLIIFRVNAETKNFAAVEGENNHFVALHFDNEMEEITYIDPTGAKCGNQIAAIAADLGKDRFEHFGAVLQYTAPTNEGGLYQMGGNDYDCGPLLALAADMMRRNFEDLNQIRLDEKQSKKMGQILRKIRKGEATLANEGSKIQVILEDAKSLPELDKLEIGGRYNLTRTDSDMTNYTDLLSEMMDDQIGEVDLDGDRRRQDDYEVFSLKTKSPKIDEIKKKIGAAKKPIRDAAKKELEQNDEKIGKKFDTPAKKNARNTREYDKRYSLSPEVTKLEKELKVESTNMVEKHLSPQQNSRRLHLFRGKALNSKKLDKAGNLVERDPEEIKSTITLKHNGVALKSDGLVANPERKDVIKSKTREYLAEIKAMAQKGESATALFGAGKAYESAVKELMTRTGAKGNTVVASSKFPWVAAEYEAGNMGGAAGGDRAVAYGYDKSKKPVRRVLGNGYVMSVSMEDYVKLRQDNDLVDVNVDMEKGVKVNQMIEEVTFNSEIPASMVKGSLPMVLPRFDRLYDDMTEEKRMQYKKVFNLDKKKYNEYRDLFLTKGDEQDVPLGMVVEHLIMHHGFLLREIAIQSDRNDGYQDQFLIPRNELYHSSNIDEIRLTGRGLAERTARVDNAQVKAKYVDNSSSAQKTVKPSTSDLGDIESDSESSIKPKKLDFSSPATSPSSSRASKAKDNDIFESKGK